MTKHTDRGVLEILAKVSTCAWNRISVAAILLTLFAQNTPRWLSFGNLESRKKMIQITHLFVQPPWPMPHQLTCIWKRLAVCQDLLKAKISINFRKRWRSGSTTTAATSKTAQCASTRTIRTLSNVRSCLIQHLHRVRQGKSRPVALRARPMVKNTWHMRLYFVRVNT